MGKSWKNIEMGVIGMVVTVQRWYGGDLVVMGACLGGRLRCVGDERKVGDRVRHSEKMRVGKGKVT